MKGYKDHLADSPSILTLNILTTGNWPTYHKTPCRIPDDLQWELDRFTRFYKVKYAGRSLAYMHSLDHCTLKADFGGKEGGGGKKELNVSLYQALVLLLFNDRGEEDKLGFKEIVAQTGLGGLRPGLGRPGQSLADARTEPKEAKRTLQSLACAKHKVLTKHPKGREVDESDEFTFNGSFRDEKYRLKINQIQQKETVEEAKETTQQVFLDRQSHLQLVIVRILKSRKTIKHTELVMEVVNVLKERFVVSVPDCKKAIDSLIERDYMERNGRDAYNYIVGGGGVVRGRPGRKADLRSSTGIERRASIDRHRTSCVWSSSSGIYVSSARRVVMTVGWMMPSGWRNVPVALPHRRVRVI